MKDEFYMDDEDDVIDITEKEILSQLADVQELADQVRKSASEQRKQDGNQLAEDDIYEINRNEGYDDIVCKEGEVFDIANDQSKKCYKRMKLIKEKSEPIFNSSTSTDAKSKSERSKIQGALSINVVPDEPMDRSLANPVENDKLLSTVKDRKSINTVMNLVVEELAEEAAYLKAWRNEQWSMGNDVSAITVKRMQILRNLINTVVEHDKMRKSNKEGKIDFYGDSFSRVLKYFLEVIQQTFHKVNIPHQYESIFFPELAKAFDNFEKKAEKIYYGKEK